MKLVCLAGVQAEQTEWLWKGRIPLGAVTILDGDPGDGKSSLTYDWAARVSTGRAMPFQDEGLVPVGVVLLQAEDATASVVRPRIEAAGGDLDRIFVPDSRGLVFGSSQLMKEITAAVKKCAAKLVVLDPFQAFCRRNLGNEVQVQEQLRPLVQLAQSKQLAVVLVRHFGKTLSRSAVQQGKGNVALIGTARSALYVVPDPDSDNQYRHVLASSKSNLGSAPAVIYQTVKVQDDVIKVEWIQERDLVNDLRPTQRGVRRPRATEVASSFLQATLANGPVGAKDIRALAAAQGISKRTLDRAKSELGIGSDKTPGPWLWAPPECPVV